jgi:hypothetical protein
MKTIFLIILVLLFFGEISNSQNLIRVNNNPGINADYTNLQDANDNANDGDTIYLEGSTAEYAGANLSKKLTIIGPGYFLSENDSTQANGLEAKLNGEIRFNAGSEGSVITGSTIDSYYLYISVDNISIARCNVYRIYINGDVDNILILQNYVDFIETSNNNGKITNSVISNNIVNYQIKFGSTSGPLQITNNVVFYTSSVYQPIDVYNSSITNNIICHPNYSIIENTGNTITNNILAVDGTNAGGNQYNVPMANVFVDYNSTQGYSTDGKWQLKNGSPALGAGVNGIDCGVFGGVKPYVLSGLPNLPHIYEATIPATANSGDGLSVTIKVKSGQ